MIDEGSPRILLVDDEPRLLAALERQLRRDYEVTVADNAKEALRLVVSKGPFAVVVSDLKMPGIDGVTFLYCVKKASPDTVRVLLTGHADIEAAMAAVNEDNVFRFLTKPCGTRVLLRAISDAVEHYQQLTSHRAQPTEVR